MGPAEPAILDTTVKAEIAQCCLISAQAACLFLYQVIEAQRLFEDPFAFLKIFLKCALANLSPPFSLLLKMSELNSKGSLCWEERSC